MTAPRTAREALIAELLGDVDRLLERVAALPALVAHAEENLSVTAKALEDAGDKYRMAVTVFTEQAKSDLSEYLDMKTNHVALMASKTVEEQRASLQEIIHNVFQLEAASLASGRDATHGETAREPRRPLWHRLAEHSFTALVASSLTASLVYLIFR